MNKMNNYGGPKRNISLDEDEPTKLREDWNVIFRKNKRMVDTLSGYDGNLRLARCCQRKRSPTV